MIVKKQSGSTQIKLINSKNNDIDTFEPVINLHEFEPKPLGNMKNDTSYHKTFKGVEESKETLNFDEFAILDDMMNDKDSTHHNMKSDTKSRTSDLKFDTASKRDDMLGDFIEPIKKQSNKERSRKSRQRKKKYYEDLETMNFRLQKQVDQLMKEVEYYKQKLKTLECNIEPTSMKKCQDFENYIINDVVEDIKQHT